MVDKITPTAYAAHRKANGLPGTTRQAVQKAIAACRLFDCVVDSQGRKYDDKDFDNDGRKYISSVAAADEEWASKTTRAPRNNPLSIDGTDDNSTTGEKKTANRKAAPKNTTKTNKPSRSQAGEDGQAEEHGEEQGEQQQERSKKVEFQDHKTRREDAQASLAELELLQKKKLLMSTPELVRDLVTIANSLQRSLIKLPDSMCDDLAADTSPQKIRVKLRNAITLALAESAEAMKKVVPKKDQELITQQIEIKL